MSQHDADSAVLVGELGPANPRPDGALESPTCGREEAQELELRELVDYLPVPLRRSGTRLVRFRQGARLQPLPYSLDEENA